MTVTRRTGLAITLSGAMLCLTACGPEQPSPDDDSAEPTQAPTAESAELKISETLCSDWAVSTSPINADSIEYASRGMDTALVVTEANCYIEPVERPGNVPEETDFVIIRVQINNLRYSSYADLGEDSPDLPDVGDPIDGASYLYNEYDEPDRGSRSCWDEEDGTTCKAETGIDGRIWAYYFKGDYQDAQFDVEMLYLTADESESMAQTSKEWALNAWTAIAETGMSSIDE